MVERLNHDATQVEVANSESRWQTSYVKYLEAVKLVRDAEDRLKNLLNYPGLKLSDEVELVPTETPFAAPVVIDHFAEVRTALEQRSEIRQARKQIEVARVGTLVAKNATLPRLDLSFQYEVQGLGNTADNSFDNLTTNRFNSYTVGASFSYSLGERASRAALRRTRLQEAQAVVLLNQVTDGIVEEVNRTIRLLMVRYTQIPPQLDAVHAAVRNLRALQARTQRIDPNYLQTELGAVEQLASTRTTLAGVLTDYNSAIVQLEKAKGTLLDYNNVIVADAQAAK
jgi:outer membrane protein TolC